MTRRPSSPAAARARSRSARGVAALALAAATLGLAGCQWTSPITTTLQYDAGDGASTQVGDVHVLNALIVSERKDGPGTLAATLENRGTSPATVPVTVGGAKVADVQLSAGQAAQLSDPTSGRLTRVPAVSEAPGAMVEVQFGTVRANIPVLAPHYPYEKFGPGGAATTDSPSPSPTTTSPATPSPASPSPPQGATP